MIANTESSAMDAPKKSFESYQSLQPADDGKTNSPQTQSNISLLSNSLSTTHGTKWTIDRIRNLISNILTLISLGFLIPGLWYPMMTLHIFAPGGAIEVAMESRSIWSTTNYLFKQGRNLSGTLIVIFAIVIPFVKTILLLIMK